MGYFFAILMSVLALFLIMLVLVQRGRGGGLTGALGGVGGSSAFGTKAGDVFTKITIIAASIWILLCVTAAYWSKHRTDALGGISAPAASAPASTSTESLDVPPEQPVAGPPLTGAQPAGDAATTGSADEPAADSASGESQ